MTLFTPKVMSAFLLLLPHFLPLLPSCSSSLHHSISVSTIPILLHSYPYLLFFLPPSLRSFIARLLDRVCSCFIALSCLLHWSKPHAFFFFLLDGSKFQPIRSPEPQKAVHPVGYLQHVHQISSLFTLDHFRSHQVWRWAPCFTLGRLSNLKTGTDTHVLFLSSPHCSILNLTWH